MLSHRQNLGPAAGRNAGTHPSMGTASVAPQGFGNPLEAPQLLDDIGMAHNATLSLLTRRRKRDLSTSLDGLAHPIVRRMPAYSDDSPEATALAARQAERLRRLRSATAKSQAAAARAAGVSKDAWNRMETGIYRINALALSRFGEAFDIPTEYVISGRLAGLPEHLSRVIAAIEAYDAVGVQQAAQAPTGNRALKAPLSQNRTIEKSTRGKAKQI